MMRNTNDQSIKTAIKDFLKSFRLEGKVQEVQIKERWAQVMGKSIARYTSDIKLRDGVVTVYLNSAPLKNDLRFQKESMIARLNEEFGETVVKEIILK